MCSLPPPRVCVGGRGRGRACVLICAEPRVRSLSSFLGTVELGIHPFVCLSVGLSVTLWYMSRVSWWPGICQVGKVSWPVSVGFLLVSASSALRLQLSTKIPVLLCLFDSLFYFVLNGSWDGTKVLMPGGQALYKLSYLPSTNKCSFQIWRIDWRELRFREWALSRISYTRRW